MKRIIYCPAGRQSWFDLALRLHGEGIATPVVWLGDPRHEGRAQAAFPDCEVLPFMPIRAGTVTDAPVWHGAHAGFFQSAEHDVAKDHAMKLMDRIDWFGAHRNVTREALFDSLVLWALALVERHDPEALVMSEAPHAPLPLILHHLFRWLGREVLCFVAWSIAPVLTLRRGYDGPVVETADPAAHDRLAGEVAQFVARFQAGGDEPRYMVQQRAKAAKIARRAQLARAAVYPFRLLVRPVTAPLSRRYAVDLEPAIVTGNLFSEDRVPRAAMGRLKATVAARRARLTDRLEQAVSAELPRDYVYFPLHYEPERTTNPDGGRFHDQLRALAVLRALLPEGTGIVAKEHPSQLSTAMRGYLGRAPGFYRVLRQIEGAVLAPMARPSSELIAGARATAVITGTAALEAACLGHRALIFGHPWFAGCPNTAQVDASSDLAEILSRPVAPRAEVADWLRTELARTGLPGCINPSNARYFAAHYEDTDLPEVEVAALTRALSRALR